MPDRYGPAPGAAPALASIRAAPSGLIQPRDGNVGKVADVGLRGRPGAPDRLCKLTMGLQVDDRWVHLWFVPQSMRHAAVSLPVEGKWHAQVAQLPVSPGDLDEHRHHHRPFLVKP